MSSVTVGRLESPQSPDVVADLPAIASVAPPLRPLRLVPRAFGRSSPASPSDKHLLQSPPPPAPVESALDGVLDLASSVAAEPTSVYRLQTPARRRRPVSLPPPPKPQSLVDAATSTLPIVVKPTRLVAHRRVEAISRSIDFGLPSAPSSVDHSLLPTAVTLPIVRRGPARLPKDIAPLASVTAHVDAVPTALPSISSVLSGFAIHYKRTDAIADVDDAEQFADAIEDGDGGEAVASALHGLGLGIAPRNVPIVTGLPEDPPEVTLDDIEGHVHRIHRAMPTVACVCSSASTLLTLQRRLGPVRTDAEPRARARRRADGRATHRPRSSRRGVVAARQPDHQLLAPPAPPRERRGGPADELALPLLVLGAQLARPRHARPPFAAPRLGPVVAHPAGRHDRRGGQR